MKYTHLFDTKLVHDLAYQGSEYEEPWVSFDDESNTIRYNKGEYESLYFTIELLSAGDVTIAGNGNGYESKIIYFHLGDGEWERVTTAAVPEYLILNGKVGDKIYIKGTNNAYGAQNFAYTYFNSTADVKIYGNLKSLTRGDSFLFAPESVSDFAFYKLFYGWNKLKNAKNLILPKGTGLASHSNMFNGCTSLTKAPELPAETLSYSCYEYMFKDCTSLTTAPTLPALSLTNGCYSHMFEGCSNLSYIKALFTSISINTSPTDWVKNVALDGTFIKNPDAVWDSVGDSGVPYSWIVVNQGQSYKKATSGNAGLMSAEDKEKLDGLNNLQYIDLSGLEPTYLTIDLVSDSDTIKWGQGADGWEVNIKPSYSYVPYDAIIELQLTNFNKNTKVFGTVSLDYIYFKGKEISSLTNADKSSLYGGVLNGEKSIKFYIHIPKENNTDFIATFPCLWEGQAYINGTAYVVYNPDLMYIDNTLSTCPYILILPNITTWDVASATLVLGDSFINN